MVYGSQIDPGQAANGLAGKQTDFTALVSLNSVSGPRGRLVVARVLSLGTKGPSIKSPPAVHNVLMMWTIVNQLDPVSF